MELVNDYDFTINYHPSGANKVADVLSQKSVGNNMGMLRGLFKELIKEIVDFGLVIVSGKLSSLKVRLLILEEIKEVQSKDVKLIKAREEVEKQISTDFEVSPDGTLLFKGRNCIPNIPKIKEQLLKKAHQTSYSMHAGVMKMYQYLKRQYWWLGMKRDLIRFMEKCLIFQQIKTEHQRPARTLQTWEIPDWKLEQVTIDFVSRLPRTRPGHDSIWVAVDHLTKSEYFIPVRTTYIMDKLAEL